MSDPYDPEEQDIRKQLVATRLALHHERCKVEVMQREIEALKRRLQDIYSSGYMPDDPEPYPAKR